MDSIHYALIRMQNQFWTKKLKLANLSGQKLGGHFKSGLQLLAIGFMLGQIKYIY
jgi:hypothetical protein